MGSSRHVDRETFLRRLRRCGLLTDAQLDEVERRLPGAQRGRLLARALVERGLLTRFQAEQILAGRTRGFLVGPYRVLELLGQGGMGCVFKAVHSDLGRVVALKAIAPRLLKSSRALKLFLREVKALKRLEHPHIVRAFDADQDGDRHYLVMEYVDGPNLDQLVRRRGPLAVGLACELVRQVADALHYASGKDMVHRDIKPANLLVQTATDPESKARVKVTDFGLARLGAPRKKEAETNFGTILTRANSVMGTPDYISPEQARNLHDADIRSDLYSLGCTFYFLLTGEVPFPGGTTLEKLVRHSVEDPVPIEQLRPDVPLAVRRVVRRLMNKEPEARFQVPAEVRDALAPFCAPGSLPSLDSDGGVPAPPSGDSSPSSAGVSDPETSLIGTMAADGSATPADSSSLPPLLRPAALESARANNGRWVLLAVISSAVGLGLAALLRLLTHM